MARPVDPARRDEHREKILSVAGRMFRESGFYGTSMRAIAQSLKVTAPFIYYHFATKRDLYYACLQKGLVELEVASSAASVDGTPTERVSALIESIGRWQIRNRGTGSAALSSSDGDSAPGKHMSLTQRRSITDVQRRYFERLKSVVEEGQRSGIFDIEDSTVASFAILAIGDHVPRWYRPGGRLSVEQIVTNNVRLALQLLGVEPKAIRRLSTTSAKPMDASTTTGPTGIAKKTGAVAPNRREKGTTRVRG